MVTQTLVWQSYSCLSAIEQAVRHVVRQSFVQGVFATDRVLESSYPAKALVPKNNNKPLQRARPCLACVTPSFKREKL